MHARPVVLLQRLGHEGGVDPALQGDLFHGEAEAHDVVRHGEGVGVADDDLVLAGGHLVVGVLHRDSHQLQGVDGLAAVLLRHVEGGEVEVAAPVEHLRLRTGVGEVEELELGGDVEGEPQLGGPLQVAPQHEAGVALEGLPVGGENVAEHPRHLLLLPPGEDLEGGGVGAGQHVGFLHPGVAVDGRAVEGHPLLEGHLQLGGADRDRLEEALHVGEPQPHEADPPLLHRPHHVLGLLFHLTPRRHRVGSAAWPSRTRYRLARGSSPLETVCSHSRNRCAIAPRYNHRRLRDPERRPWLRRRPTCSRW